MFNQTKNIDVLIEIEEFIKNQNDEILHALKIIYPRVSSYEHWPDDGGFKFIFGDAEIFVPYASLTFFAQGLLYGERPLKKEAERLIGYQVATIDKQDLIIKELNIQISAYEELCAKYAAFEKMLNEFYKLNAKG